MKEKRSGRIIGLITGLMIPVLLVLTLAGGSIYIFQKNVTDISKSVKTAIIGKEGESHTVNECVLKEVVTQSKLYTFDYPYKGYASKYDDDGEALYHVYYEGSVKVYIDANEIEYSVDDENSTIKVMLPEITIEDPVVDAGSMDYIFNDEDENDEDVTQESYRIANADIKEQIKNDKTFGEAANKSVETTVRGLIDPWINKYSDKDYTVVIVSSENEK